MDPVVKNVKRYYSCVDETCKVGDNHVHVDKDIHCIPNDKNYLDIICLTHQ